MDDSDVAEAERLNQGLYNFVVRPAQGGEFRLLAVCAPVLVLRGQSFGRRSQ
jgi:hypothetical protein